MKVKLISERENPLLKRREIYFQVEHTQTGGTPPRLEVRKTIADALKTNIDLVYVKKLKTKTGTQVAAGIANCYESVEQALLVEPEYIVKRNSPPEKPEEEERKE